MVFAVALAIVTVAETPSVVGVTCVSPLAVPPPLTFNFPVSLPYFFTVNVIVNVLPATELPIAVFVIEPIALPVPSFKVP